MTPLPHRDPGATRLCLIRHAAAALEPGCCCGSLDVPLSETGLERATLLGRALADVELAAVYTSPLLRARQTAAELAGHRVERTPRELPGLAEIDFGSVEGKRFDEIAVTHPETYAAWLQRPTETDFPGGERFADFAARVRESIREILVSHPGDQVAIVSHGGPLRLVLADALAMPTAAMFRLDVSCGGLSVVDRYEEASVLRVLNARLFNGGEADRSDWGMSSRRCSTTSVPTRGLM